jgi:hypothetical protein
MGSTTHLQEAARRPKSRDRAAPSVEVGLGEIERLADPETGRRKITINARSRSPTRAVAICSTAQEPVGWWVARF